MQILSIGHRLGQDDLSPRGAGSVQRGTSGLDLYKKTLTWLRQGRFRDWLRASILFEIYSLRISITATVYGSRSTEKSVA